MRVLNAEGWQQRVLAVGLGVAVLLAGFLLFGRGGAEAASSTQSKAVSVGVKYTGGKAGKATKSSIGIGWVNQDQSPAGNAAENTDAIKAAIKFVNGELGGVDGHPLKLIQCKVGASEQQGKQCAQKFLNDKSVKVIMSGYVIIGGGPFMSTIAPKGTALKPVVAFGPLTPTDVKTKNAYYTSGGFFANAIFPYFVRDYMKTKTISKIYSDDPSLTPFIELQVASYKAAGIETQVGRVSATATDVVGPLVASGARTQAGIQVDPASAGQCTAIAKGLRQLGLTAKPVLGFSVCLEESVKKALGDYPKNWNYYRSSLHPDVTEPTGQVAALNYAVRKYVAKSKVYLALHGPYAADQFGALMVVAKMLNGMGADKINAAGFAAQTKSFKGGIFLGYPRPKWGASAETPSLAGIFQRFYQYKGSGKWTDATKGKWLLLSSYTK